MALSNWDTLAINNSGKGCNGEVKGKLASLEIYKNWAYIHSKKMWNEDTGYVKDVIAQINSGNLYLGGLNIQAIRHESQNSIFVFVDAGTYNKKRHDNFFAGIGCYAYYSKVDEYLNWKGIELKYADYNAGSRNYRINEKGETIHIREFIDIISFYDENDKLITELEVDKEFGELTDFVGVMPKTFEAFKKWLMTEIAEEYKYDKQFEKWLKKINWDEITRFNQGDAFFVGTENASTEVGKQDNDTLLSQALK